MIEGIKNAGFTPMKYFSSTKDLSEGVLDHGTKMGEGWLLTAEMMELVEIGYERSRGRQNLPPPSKISATFSM